MKYNVAVWDSSERGLAHWKFGKISTGNPLEALQTILPFARLDEVKHFGPYSLSYDFDGDVAYISTDKDWVANKVTDAIREFDFEEHDLGVS